MKDFEKDGAASGPPAGDTAQALRDDASVAPPERAPEAPANPADKTSSASKSTESIDKANSTRERNAQTELDVANLPEKLGLSPEQSNLLRSFEGAILKGDASTVKSLLQKNHGDPDALKPVMDVLAKDLAKAGVRANYDVNFALTDKKDGDAERTGIFDISTAKSPEDFFNKDSTFICFYTNPNSTGFAENRSPHLLKNGGFQTPDSVDLTMNQGLKEVSGKVINNLLEKKN